MKHSKVANILGDMDRRKSGSVKDKTSRRGSRESLDMSYDGDEVGITVICNLKKSPIRLFKRSLCSLKVSRVQDRFLASLLVIYLYFINSIKTV